MHRRGLTAVATMVMILLGVGGCTGDEPGFRPTFTPVTCPSEVTAVMLELPGCGYLTVLERRDRPTGARIKLFVVRIDPPGEASPDPMVMVGEALGNRIEYGGLAPMAARTHRTVYMLDQRGTGLSEPNLSCPEVREQAATLLGLQQSAPQFGRVFLDAVRRCHSRLIGKRIDLSAYNLAESAADVADLRLAVDSDEINLIGTGTAYCRDDGNMYYGHVEQIASSEERDSLLLRCPMCGWMHELRADGISEPRHVSESEARKHFSF